MNSNKQCMNSDFCLCTMNPCEVTVHVQEKKKKGETWTGENAGFSLKQTVTVCSISHLHTLSQECTFMFILSPSLCIYHLQQLPCLKTLNSKFLCQSYLLDQLPFPRSSIKVHAATLRCTRVSMQCIAYNKLLPTFTAFMDRCSTLLVGDTPMCIYSKSIYNKMTTFQYNR